MPTAARSRCIAPFTARLGQELLGQVGVVLVRLDRWVEAEVLRVQQGRRAVAARLERVDVALDVAGVVRGVAYLHVLERVGTRATHRVEPREADAQDRLGDRHRHAGRLDRLHLVERHHTDDVDVLRQKLGEQRRDAGDEAQDEVLVGRLDVRVPVVVVAREDELLPALPLDELVRPGADGVLGQPGVALLLGELLGDHLEVLQPLGEDRVRLLRRHVDGV
ncbi:MAG TPA: hypothetical protein PKA95_10495, partial [Thermomicrobiales bacterium]|nr:hypothetical protein [Thermomicrobiales bacterium]